MSEPNEGLAPVAPGTMLGTTPTPEPTPKVESAVGETTLGAAPPVAAVEPLALDKLTLPEGMAKDDAALAPFIEVMNKADLTPQARAEALMAMHAERLKAAAEGPAKAYKEINEQWRKEMAADSEIGGERLQRDVLPAVSRVIDRFGGDQFRQALDLTGMGNNPHMAKFLWNVAKALNEGQHVGGNPPNTAKQPMTAAQAMYPHLINQR